MRPPIGTSMGPNTVHIGWMVATISAVRPRISGKGRRLSTIARGWITCMKSSGPSYFGRSDSIVVTKAVRFQPLANTTGCSG